MTRVQVKLPQVCLLPASLQIALSQNAHKKLFPIFPIAIAASQKSGHFGGEQCIGMRLERLLIFDAFGFVCKNSLLLEKKEGANVKNKYAIVLGEKCISQLGAFKGLN